MKKLFKLFHRERRRRRLEVDESVPYLAWHIWNFTKGPTWLDQQAIGQNKQNHHHEERRQHRARRR